MYKDSTSHYMLTAFGGARGHLIMPISSGSARYAGRRVYVFRALLGVYLMITAVHLYQCTSSYA